MAKTSRDKETRDPVAGALREDRKATAYVLVGVALYLGVKLWLF